MAQTDYERKIEQWFDEFDQNGDSTITIDDFERVAGQILTEFEMGLDTAKGSALLEGARRFFAGLAEAVDVDRDGSLSKDEWVQGACQRLRNNASGFAAIAEPWVTGILAVADANDDGIVTSDEYRRVLVAMGAQPEQVDSYLSALDINHDGHIDVNELVSCVTAIYTTDIEDSAFSRD